MTQKFELGITVATQAITIQMIKIRSYDLLPDCSDRQLHLQTLQLDLPHLCLEHWIGTLKTWVLAPALPLAYWVTTGK